MLLFDDGRVVKLSDFSTAVSVSKITEKWQHTNGRLIYSAAPEVIQEETPFPSSDMWSAMCTLVQMLTSKHPGCHKGHRRPMAMMLLVRLSMEYWVSNSEATQHSLCLITPYASVRCKVIVLSFYHHHHLKKKKNHQISKSRHFIEWPLLSRCCKL